MGRYKEYQEYKNSEVEWLGKVPLDWDIKKIKHLSPVKRGASPRPIDDPKYFDEEGGYSWVRIADVSASDTYLYQTTQKMSELGSSLSVKLEPNQLFLSIAGTVGKPCINKITACIHDGFVYFPDLKIPNKFLFYVFAGEQAYKGLGKMGTQLNLNTDTVGGIKVAIPKKEQDIQAIINFLDYETTQIDTLIEKQQQLIKLLKEKRQAVISHAVTKGLNPDAPMKDSGVEWLGEVPAHWSVTPLAGVADVIDPNPSHRNPKYTDDGFPFISTVEFTGIDNVEINTPRRVAEETVLEQEKRCNFQEGSIAFSRKGTIGAVRILPHGIRFALLDSVCVINCGETVLYEFLYQQCRSSLFESQLGAETRGAALKQVSVGRVRAVKTFIPPLEEQKEILAYLNEALSKLDKTVELANKQVNYLTERRTALISAAVTGKIDVRSWQKPKAQEEGVA